MIIWVFLALAVLMILAFAKLWAYADLVVSPDVTPVVNFPDMFGLTYEKVAFSSADGANIKGWWVPATTPTAKTIICSHGWASNKGEILNQTWYLSREGFNILYFDFRGCGESPRHGPSSLGFFEIRDLEAALNYVLKSRRDDAQELSLYGLSMGASVSFLMACDKNWASRIRALACEAPFARFDKVAGRYGRIHFGMPEFPLLDVVCFLIWLKSGRIDNKKASPIAHAGSFNVSRFFLFYGDQDALSPAQDGRDLLASMAESSVAASSDFWLCPQAGHAQCWDKQPDIYRQKLTKFFKGEVAR